MKAEQISKSKSRRLWAEVALASLLVSSNLLAQPWILTSAPTNQWWTSVASSADGTKLVAVANAGGIYTSKDSGGTWSATPAPSNHWDAVVSSSDGVKLAAAAASSEWNGPVYSSSDSGATWAPTTVAAANWSGLASSSDGTKLVAVGWPSPIWISSDSGATWAAASAPTNKWCSVASSADGARLVAIESGGGVWTSEDGGTTWNRRFTFVIFSGSGWVSVACSADGIQLVAGVHGIGIFTSKDAGLTWKKRVTDGSDHQGAASSADGTKLVVASAGIIWTSTDGGTNWTSTYLHIDPFPSVASSTDGSKLALTAEYVGIYVWGQTPALSLAPAGNNLSISWPNLSSAEGFSLEASGTLNASDAAWAPVTQAPVVSKSAFCLTNDLSVPSVFFRLHKH